MWYIFGVLSRKIREERERLGVTQAALARASGVPRSQLAAFESGANVTVSTIERILREISTLRLDVVPASLDLEAARRAAEELETYAAYMQVAAARLVASLGGSPKDMRAARTELTADDAASISPQKRAELERLVEEIRMKKGGNANGTP